MLKSKSVAVGGGCVEAALSIYLENFAMDSADLVAFHNSSQTTKVSTLDFEEEDST